MGFASPDTLIPDPSNPLDYNRYGYARYNPLKYTDPTGHLPDNSRVHISQPEIDTENLTYLMGRYPKSPSEYKHPVNGNQPKPVQHPSDQISNQTPDPLSRIQTTPSPPSQPSVQSQGSYNPPSDSEITAFTLEQIHVLSITYLEYISRANPTYRHVKGLVPGMGGEFVLGAFFQVIEDWDGDYTPYQRGGRAFIAGAEDVAIDVVGNLLVGPVAGILCLPATPVGSATAYLISGVAVNYLGEFIIFPAVNNSILYPVFGLE